MVNLSPVTFSALRAAVFASVCVALAVTAHDLGNGQVVEPAPAGVGFGLIFVAGLLVGRAERSQWAITGCVLAGQGVLHVLFNFASGMASAHGIGCGIPAGHCGLAMLFGHIGAATITGWWLRRGEAAAWRLLRRLDSAALARLRAALAQLAEVAAPFPRRLLLHAYVGVVEPDTRIRSSVAYSLSRRGPPRAVRIG